MQILNVYRQMMPQFDQFLSQLPPREREALRANFGL